MAVALATAAGGWGQAQFWGELKAGRYAVGFRSLYQLDVARSYDTDYPAAGSVSVIVKVDALLGPAFDTVTV